MAVLQRDGIAGADEIVLDGDDAAGEEALVELPGAAGHVDGAVLANAAAKVLQERGGEHRFVDGAALRRGPRLRRRLAEEPAVRREVAVVGAERAEAYLHVVQRGQPAAVVEAAGAQRAP